jgi:hypothetical protein
MSFLDVQIILINAGRCYTQRTLLYATYIQVRQKWTEVLTRKSGLLCRHMQLEMKITISLSDIV